MNSPRPIVGTSSIETAPHVGAGDDQTSSAAIDIGRPDAPDSGPAADAAALEALLGRNSEKRRVPMRMLVAVGVVVILAIAGVFAVRALRSPAAPQYSTAPLRRGDLVVSVSATGTLEPVNQVDVGSELSGTVDKVLVDDNDLVAKGQVLATLDASRLRDQITNVEAALAAAEANLQQSEATAREAALKADRLHRLYGLSAGGYPAKADIDAADAALDRSRAGVASARAGVKQAAAALNTGRTNLEKAAIRSPVSGVVLARKIEPGQTVAASLQAPVLFTLAEDMRRMELHVDVDEADVGQVRQGQPATFTVDAYPGRDYPARVTRVGLGSQTKEGVVTYTGVLAVDNADLTLRPGMTASAEITSDRRPNVLLVPEAALRYRPQAAGSARSASLANALTPRVPRFGSTPRKRSTDANVQQIWILRDGQALMLPVRVGATNGRETEISGEGLSPGLPVITGSATQ